MEVISLDVFTQWLNHLCLLIATYSWILLWLEIAVVFLSVGYLQCFDTLCCVMGRASDLRNLLHLSQRFHSVLGNNSRKEDSWIKLLTSKMPWWRCRSIKCVVIRRSWLHKSFNGNNKWWRFKYYNQTLGWKAAVQFPSGVHVDEKRMRSGHLWGQWFVFPSVLWHWWLGGRKDIWPIKIPFH